MMIKLLLLCEVWLLFLGKNTIICQVPEIKPYKSSLTMKAGDTLQLICPIYVKDDSSTSDNTGSSKQSGSSSLGNNLMYEWKIKDFYDVSYTYNNKYSFENNSKVLRITKPLTIDDNGKYVCNGITGFGTKSAEFSLEVIDNSQKRLCATKKISDPRLDPPCYVDTSKRSGRDTTITKEIGQSLQLDCSATGSEPIKYVWFHGNTIANWIQTKSGIRGPSLAVASLKSTYTGLFTCQVSNAAGSVNYTYRVIVKESPRNTPKIITELTNHTYSVGQRAVITVKIECLCNKPIIKWLKRVDKSEDRDDMKTLLLPNSRASEKGEYYITLDTGIFVKKSPTSQQQSLTPPINIYESQLILDPVDAKSSPGKYIITAINKIVNLKHLEYGVVYINVKSDAKQLEIRNNLVVYIAVPIVILVSSLGVIIYCCIQRHGNINVCCSGHSNHQHLINGHIGRNSTVARQQQQQQRPGYHYGNGSSVNGSDKLKSSQQSSTTASTGFPGNGAQLLGNHHLLNNNNNIPGLYTPGYNNNNNHHPQMSSSPLQSNYDQYSVLSVSHSSHSNPNNHSNTLPSQHHQQHQLHQQQQHPSYFHPVTMTNTSVGAPPPLPVTPGYYHSNNQSNGYVPLPMQQYPA